MQAMKKIIMLCTRNRCRSQMAEGYLNYSAKGKAAIYSTCIETQGVKPIAILVLKEDGINISSNTANHIDKCKAINLDFVITVCDNAKERCPFLPDSAKKFHHNFSNPAKAKGSKAEILTEFRSVRNLIREYCKAFVAENI
jgi:arsenate reductase